MDFRQLKQLLKYANQNAEEISQMPEVNLSKSSLFMDILRCYFKYHVYAIQYKKEKFWQLSPEQRNEVAKKYQEKNLKNEAWAKDYYENFRFLIKWTAYKYEATAKQQKRRAEAYRRRYNMGDNCFIGHDVIIERHHYLWGTVQIGNNCTIAKHVYIDYSGELFIHDDVALANGVIIETHTHLIEKKGAPPTPGRLEIEKGVKILTRAYIADTCHFIGRYARIGAGTYIRGNVLPYSIMIGNPAKIVGFMYTPEEVAEFEKAIFPESERTDLEKYKQDYKKYYIDRRKEIKSFLQK
jgi:acetyltransferase-like isoleucine patch superfamily enzyme